MNAFDLLGERGTWSVGREDQNIRFLCEMSAQVEHEAWLGVTGPAREGRRHDQHA